MLHHGVTRHRRVKCQRYRADIMRYTADIMSYKTDIVRYTADVMRYTADIVRYRADIIRYSAPCCIMVPCVIVVPDVSADPLRCPSSLVCARACESLICDSDELAHLSSDRHSTPVLNLSGRLVCQDLAPGMSFARTFSIGVTSSRSRYYEMYRYHEIPSHELV